MARKIADKIAAKTEELSSVIADARADNKVKNPVVAEADTPLTKQVLVISLIANLLGLAMPLAIFQVYDRILPNQAGATLFWLIAGLLAAVILDTILRSLRSYILGWAALKNGHRAQQLAMNQLLNANPDERATITRSKWLDGLDAIAEYSNFQGSQNRTILIDIPMAFIFLAMVALVGGTLVFVPIVLIIAFGLFSFLQGQEIQSFLDNRSQQDTRQNDFLLETFSNIQTVKNLAVESQLLRRFEMLQKTSTVSSYHAIISTNKLQTQGVVFSNMMMICVVSFGAVRVIGGDMSLAALACCSLLTGRMVQPFARALTLFHEIQNIRLARKRCNVFDRIANKGLQHDESRENLTKGAFSIRNLVLPSNDKNADVEPYNLTATPGEFIGIHCQENAERTEFVSFLNGKFLPENGNVFADGFSSKQWHELGINREIGFVSAKTEIFEGTIIDNLTMFGGANLVESAREASRLIGLEQDIFKLPDGYDTVLSIGSASILSPGFLQRIKIARAIRKQPKIFIFDGANSNMDMRSDKLLADGLSTLKGKMTAVYFSSRPSFLKICDQRLRMHDGHLLPDDFVQPKADKPSAQSAS
ncbi:MAG: ABC transporter transmembrane domain-containing protein [Lentilitoribacter sp.]